MFDFDLGLWIAKCMLKNIVFECCLFGSVFGGGGVCNKSWAPKHGIYLLIYFYIIVVALFVDALILMCYGIDAKHLRVWVLVVWIEGWVPKPSFRLLLLPHIWVCVCVCVFLLGRCSYGCPAFQCGLELMVGVCHKFEVFFYYMLCVLKVGLPNLALKFVYFSLSSCGWSTLRGGLGLMSCFWQGFEELEFGCVQWELSSRLWTSFFYTNK